MSQIDSDVSEVRRLTRQALPSDDGYLYRLGVAIYGFASINSFLTEVTCYIDPTLNRTKLMDKTSGHVLKTFKEALENWNGADIARPADRVVVDFGRLNNERTDFVHAYPITSQSGEQILHRRKDQVGKYFEVSNDFLNDFISRLHDVSVALYEIRAIVRPHK